MLAACTTPAPDQPEPRAPLPMAVTATAVASALPSVSAITSAAPLPPAPTSPIEKVALADVACEAQQPPGITLRGDPASRVRLCDEKRERCYLEAVEIPFFTDSIVAKAAKGKSPGFLVELTYQGMTLRGFIAQPRLFAARPMVFGGYFIPEEIALEEGLDKKLRASAPLEPWIKPIKPAELDVGCDDLAWDGSSFDEEFVMKLTTARGEEQRYALIAETTLLSGKGTPLATLTPQDAPHLEGYQRAGTRRLVVARINNGTLFGWVDEKALGTNHAAMGFRRGFMGRARMIQNEQPSNGIRCSADVPVLAIVGDSRLEIGTITAGTWFTPGPVLDELHREVVLRHPRFRVGGVLRVEPTIQVASGVKLAVLSDAIAKCQTKTE